MLNNFFSIPVVKLLALVAGGLVLAALIFDAGVDFGAQQGGVPHDGHFFFKAFGVALPHLYISHGHGAVGAISAVGTSSFTIVEPDGDSEAVWINGSTTIEAPEGPTTTSAFKPGVHVIVIGSPNESGEYIGAKFIRVLPPPPQPTQ
jgi:hypothetical protein